MQARFWVLVLVAMIVTDIAIAEPSDNSLHFKRTGKAYFYAAENGGFERLTGIPFADLHCKQCHHDTDQLADGTIMTGHYEPSCADCHDLEMGTEVNSPDVCLSCHSRQRAEIAHFDELAEPRDLSWQDVHVRRGMTCIDCHTGEHLHQDAGDQHSMLAPGGIDARCEACHAVDGLEGAHHRVHGDRLACAACHVKSALTCNNCHFDTELVVNGMFKRPISQGRGFMLLVNRKGSGPGGVDQVYPATYQSLVFKGKSYYSIAPYSSHTIMMQGRDCRACHQSERLEEYDATGKVRMTRWNEDAHTLEVAHGVVPVPTDWRQALQFDFADFTGDLRERGQQDKWVFLKQGADAMNMINEFAAPLTAEQLEKLRTAVPMEGTSLRD